MRASFKMEKIIHYCVVFSILITAVFLLNVNEEFHKTDAICQYNFSAATGKVYLKNITHFPGECYWNITTNSSSKIALFLTHLFLDGEDTVTFYDSLENAKNDTSPLFNNINAQIGSFVILTEKPIIFVKLKGPSTSAYQRKFEIMYHSQDCVFTIPPDVTLITSPMLLNVNKTVECSFIYMGDMQHHWMTPTFTFEEFNLSTSSSITLKGSTVDGPYKNDIPPIDFFPNSNPMHIDWDFDPNENSSFRFKMHHINPDCAEYKEISDSNQYTFASPPATLDNGTIINECRWILHNPKKGILGITFNKLEFDNVLDIIAINNGGSELSPPLTQVTSANRNDSTLQLIRTTRQYMWVSFKPMSFASSFSANVSIHEQGGYYNGSGTIAMTSTTGNDTVFLLEVKKDEVVLLNFKTSQLSNPAMIRIYDDFMSTNLLTTLHKPVWYPILSRTSKMMIIATGFNAGSFSADFKGISPGCMHMSTLNTDSYILSGNCNATCTWVVPPQDTLSNEVLLHLQYLSLDVNDKLEIISLDANKTLLGTVFSNVSHVPQLTIPASVGVFINVTRGSCKRDSDVILVGHISYLPACGATMSVHAAQVLQVTSPSYPDTYPLFSKCTWNINGPKDNLLHIAFNKLKLAANHCLTVKQTVDNTTVTYTGESLPEDEFINGSTVVEFNSWNCGSPKVHQTLVSDEGFEFNLTVADCGNLLKNISGELKFTDVKNKSMCIWKISVPETGSDKSFILFNVSRDSADKGELSVYDGASVRNAPIKNFTSESWSKTNSLIVTYKITNGTAKGFTLSYATKSCNTSMQCEKTKFCIHSDWRCNGKDDCGDFTDEKNCASVPVPPETVAKGFSSTAYGLSVVLFFILGAAVAILGPYGYRRFCRSDYRQFGQISTID